MFSNSLKVARIFGINVEIDMTWLIVFMILSYSLATNYFPSALPGAGETMWWVLGVSATLLLFASVLVHEFAHSLVAIKEGHTIKRITLFIFGGVAHLEEEPRTSIAELKITIVGPLSSLGLALLFWLIYLVVPQATPVAAATFFLASINLTISLVNLVPAFPLDGGRVLRALIWYFKKDLLTATRVSVMAGSAFAFLLMGIGFYTILTISIMGLWYIFLGWLLYQAGQNSYTQVTLKNSLSGYRVKDLMTDQVVVVSTELNIRELVNEFYRYKVGAFPVVGGSALAGMVTMNQVRNVDRRQWDQYKVRDVMTPIDACIKMHPEDEAADAMMEMAKKNAGRILVMEEGKLVGILSNTDVMRLIRMRTALGE